MVRRYALLMCAAAFLAAVPRARETLQARTPGALVDSIASPTGPGAAEPNLAVAPDGRVYLSWLEPADSGFALRFSVFSNNAWSVPRTIVSRRDFFVNWADFPSLEVLGAGRLAAHWLQRNGPGTYAYGV